MPMQLERRPHKAYLCAEQRPATSGRKTHAPSELLPRHVHPGGFFALVLNGSYVEAGDTGRHRVVAGDVIVHRPYEHHVDRFSNRGAEALILPLPGIWTGAALARIEDPDTVARLAERDLVSAAECLVGAAVEKPLSVEDWPDLLARDLIADPCLSLSEWAERHDLHPGSLARGFQQQFDVSPAGYRTAVRTNHAIQCIVSTQASLSAIASELGFSDQAHMTRSVRRMTNQSPRSLRLHARSLAKTDDQKRTELG